MVVERWLEAVAVGDSTSPAEVADTAEVVAVEDREIVVAVVEGTIVVVVGIELDPLVALGFVENPREIQGERREITPVKFNLFVRLYICVIVKYR